MSLGSGKMEATDIPLPPRTGRFVRERLESGALLIGGLRPHCGYSHLTIELPKADIIASRHHLGCAPLQSFGRTSCNPKGMHASTQLRSL